MNVKLKQRAFSILPALLNAYIRGSSNLPIYSGMVVHNSKNSSKGYKEHSCKLDKILSFFWNMTNSFKCNFKILLVFSSSLSSIMPSCSFKVLTIFLTKIST